MTDQEGVEGVQASEEAVQAAPTDLRCLNDDCTLHGLRLDADEIASGPGGAPDRCAGCRGILTPYSDHAR
jgi:hypothetical protein